MSFASHFRYQGAKWETLERVNPRIQDVLAADLFEPAGDVGFLGKFGDSPGRERWFQGYLCYSNECSLDAMTEFLPV